MINRMDNNGFIMQSTLTKNTPVTEKETRDTHRTPKVKVSSDVDNVATVITTKLYNLTVDLDVIAGGNISGYDGIFTGAVNADTIDAFTLFGANIETLTGTIDELRTGRILLRDGISNSIEIVDPTSISNMSFSIRPGPLTFSRILTLPDHAGSFAISGGTMDTYFNSVKLAGAAGLTNNSDTTLINQRGAAVLATNTGSISIASSDPLAGQVLIADGVGGATWTTPSAGGITSLNGSTNAVQTFAYGTAGTAPAWSTTGGTHTLNIPNAGASVTGGLITNGAQTIAGAKTLSSTLTMSGSSAISIGNGGLITSGNINAGNLTLAGSITLPGNINLTASNSVILNNGNVTSNGNFAFGNGTLQGSLTFGASVMTLNLGGTGNITSNGNLSVANITSSTNSLNGITIPATGGTLAKLSDIPNAANALGLYSSNMIAPYIFDPNIGPVTPATLTFPTTTSQAGMSIGGSNAITITNSGLYEIRFDGYVVSDDIVQSISIIVTVNGVQADIRTFTQDTTKIFNGIVQINSILNLSANDVIRISIVPYISDLTVITLLFNSIDNTKHSNLIIRKL